MRPQGPGREPENGEFPNARPGYGSVRFGYGLGVERYVRAVPVFGSSGCFGEWGLLCFRSIAEGGRSDGSGFRFRFGSWATSQKWLREGAKGLFGPREQGSPKLCLHHPNLVVHRCNPLLHLCNKALSPLARKTFCTLFQPLLGIFQF